MLDQNTLLIVIGFLIFIYLFANQRPSSEVQPVIVRVNDNSTLVDRTGSDWNRSGSLVEEVGLNKVPLLQSSQSEARGAGPVPPFNNSSIKPPFTEEAVKFKGTVAPWTPEEPGGPGYRDSYGQLKSQDEIYPNYYNKYEVFTSDQEPWWRNQHFWPYYMRGYNLQYRYPYFEWWKRPYFYNYWSSPYFPSRTVLIKPYLRDEARKSLLRDKLAENFRRAKINDSPRST